jgi:hypothetical protein
MCLAYIYQTVKNKVFLLAEKQQQSRFSGNKESGKRMSCPSKPLSKYGETDAVQL